MNRRIPNVALPIALSIAFLAVFAPTQFAAAQSDTADWPAGVAERKELSEQRSYDYDFSKVSVKTLQTWLGRIRITLPVQLDGELSGWVWAQRSAKSWFDFGNYRIEGEITSPELKIDKWTVAEAGVRFGYAGGNWFIGSLHGELQSPEAKTRIGIAQADAKILSATTSNIEINAKVDKIDLKSLLQSFGLGPEIKNSGGSVSLQGTVPIATLSDLSTWTATTDLELDDFVLPWIESPGKAFANIKLADGVWEVTDGRIKVAEQDLIVSGAGKLDADLPFKLLTAGSNIDASQLFRQLKNNEIAEQIAGAIGIEAQVIGNQSNGIESATATVQSDLLTFKAQPIKQLNVRAAYARSGIQLEIARAELASGEVSGSAKWSEVKQLARGFPADAKLKFDQLNLEELGWIDLPIQMRGVATGVLTLDTKTRDGLEDWSSTGRIQIDGLEAAGTKLGRTRVEWDKEGIADQVTATVSVHQGNGSLQSKIVAKLVDRPDSKIRSTELSQYRAEGQLQDYDLVARYGNAPSEEIPIQAVGNFDVKGSPANWLESGTATLSESTAMWGERLIRLETANASFSKDEFRLEYFRMVDPTGRVEGAASFRRNNAGEHLLRLRIGGVELNPYLQRLAPQPLKSLDGLVAVELELRKDAASASPVEDWSGRSQASLSELKIDGKPIGFLELTGEVANQVVAANAQGRLVGGDANATLKLPLSICAGQSSANSQQANLQFRLDKLQARQLADLFFERSFAAKIKGEVSLDVVAAGSSPDDFRVTTQIAVPRLTQNRNALARDLTAQLTYSGGKLIIDRVSGGLADGRIDAQGQLDLNEADFTLPEGGKINFVAQRLDASNLVALFAPKYVKYYLGIVNYRGTATFRRGFQLNGQVSIKNGSLLGIPIETARGALRTEFSRDGKFRRLVSKDLHGSGVGGNFKAELAIDGRNRLSLKTKGNVTRGKLELLSQALGFQKSVGSGTFDGSFELRSNQIESLNSLTGGLQIEFENGDVESIPLLSSLDRFVPLVQFASTDIENGRLNARVGQGQLRISDLTLNSTAFWLLASGSASLDGSKIDIDAVLQTGGGVEQRAAQTLLDLSLAGTIPQVAAINQLNEFIRNRSIFFHVGGSPSRPVVQAKPGQTAAKAFLQEFGRGSLNTTPWVNE